MAGRGGGWGDGGLCAGGDDGVGGFYRTNQQEPSLTPGGTAREGRKIWMDFREKMTRRIRRR